MDGGVYENDEISIEEAAEELLEDEGWTGERIRGDYDRLMEKVEEMDEVVMAEIQKSQGEYKPLAKVEELEEANYNMIDNVLNNMPPKKEAYLEYFAAECDEFHDMGAYEKSTDVNQIAAVYEKYREHPKTAYLGCSMGIIYRDPEDSYYDDTEFAIVKGNTVLEKGINVIQEHPIDIDDYIMCIKIAQKNCCMYRLNTFYPQLSNVKQFIFLAGKLREKNDVQYINAECSVHVLFPLIDILGRAIGGLRPWKFERVEETYKNSPFCIIYGSIYNIPICINVQNQMDPSDPENSVLLFHKISLYTECGNLTMIGTNSDIMWEPRIRKYIAADGGFHLEADDEYLDLPVYEEMHNDEGKCFREMFSDTWPDSIKLFLEDFYRDFYLGKKMDSNAQFLISVCQAWKDLGNSIGSANIIHAYTTKPIKISEIVK